MSNTITITWTCDACGRSPAPDEDMGDWRVLQGIDSYITMAGTIMEDVESVCGKCLSVIQQKMSSGEIAAATAAVVP